MPRSKPFSGKQKREQLKAKREKKRGEKSDDDDDNTVRDVNEYTSVAQSLSTLAGRSDVAGITRGGGGGGAGGTGGRNAGSKGVKPSSSQSLSSNNTPTTSIISSDLHVSLGQSNANMRQLSTMFFRESKQDVEARKNASALRLNLSLRDKPLYAVAPGVSGDHLEHPKGVLLRAGARGRAAYQAEGVRDVEESSFSAWLQQIYSTYQRQDLNTFEHNLDVWMQLWHTLATADVIVLVADARNPLWHIPQSLYTQIVEELKKPLVIVLNKMDLVPNNNNNNNPTATTSISGGSGSGGGEGSGEKRGHIQAWIAWLQQVYPAAHFVPFTASGADLSVSGNSGTTTTTTTTTAAARATDGMITSLAQRRRLLRAARLAFDEFHVKRRIASANGLLSAARVPAPSIGVVESRLSATMRHGISRSDAVLSASTGAGSGGGAGAKKDRPRRNKNKLNAASKGGNEDDQENDDEKEDDGEVTEEEEEDLDMVLEEDEDTQNDDEDHDDEGDVPEAVSEDDEDDDRTHEGGNDDEPVHPVATARLSSKTGGQGKPISAAASSDSDESEVIDEANNHISTREEPTQENTKSDDDDQDDEYEARMLASLVSKRGGLAKTKQQLLNTGASAAGTTSTIDSSKVSSGEKSRGGDTKKKLHDGAGKQNNHHDNDNDDDGDGIDRFKGRPRHYKRGDAMKKANEIDAGFRDGRPRTTHVAGEKNVEEENVEEEEEERAEKVKTGKSSKKKSNKGKSRGQEQDVEEEDESPSQTEFASALSEKALARLEEAAAAAAAAAAATTTTTSSNTTTTTGTTTLPAADDAISGISFSTSSSAAATTTSSPSPSYRIKPLTLGMVGHPNVGKSSVINTLCGEKKVSVSRTAGHTKRAQTIHLVHAAPGIEPIDLLDCPGLVFPRTLHGGAGGSKTTTPGTSTTASPIISPSLSSSSSASATRTKAMQTAEATEETEIPENERAMQECCGVIPLAQVREPYTSIRFLAEHLPLERLYGLSPPRDELADLLPGEVFEWTPLGICEALARKRGYFIARTGRPDSHSAGRAILYDTQDGIVPLWWLPPRTMPARK